MGEEKINKCMYRTIHKKESKEGTKIHRKQMQETRGVQRAQRPQGGKLVVITSVYNKLGQRKTDEFVKKFYGQTTTSHKGKYRYRRKGLLDEIPHIKLGKGVLIIKHTDLDKVTRFLDEWEADYTTRDITLNQNDQKTLTQKPTK
jgi:hypothetical protein